MARHSSPRPAPFTPPLAGFAGFGVPALAGAGGPGLFGGGPRFAPSRPVDNGRTAAFVGGSGRAPALPAPALPARPAPALRPAPTRSAPTRATPPGGPRPPGSPRSDDRGARRPSPLSGRLAVAAVAAGALATAGHSLVSSGLDAPTGETRTDLALSAAATAVPATATPAPSALDAATTGVMAISPSAPTGTSQVASLAKSRKVADAVAAKEAAARAPQVTKLADGRFTSGFGARWGTSHRGVDIANAIGTPIVSPVDGTVLESGPASGFGLWIRVQLEDGTINVYGHINRSYVKEGQKVKAGEQIAEIGNRGQSTGPHLHFEVWTAGGSKINPLPWLAERGISLGASKD